MILKGITICIQYCKFKEWRRREEFSTKELEEELLLIVKGNEERFRLSIK